MSANNNHSMLSQAEELLRTTWGYEAFRPVQGDIITSVLSGRDTLALTPEEERLKIRLMQFQTYLKLQDAKKASPAI
jgi:hypothetical protein